jgi:hypothetical protein
MYAHINLLTVLQLFSCWSLGDMSNISVMSFLNTLPKGRVTNTKKRNTKAL